MDFEGFAELQENLVKALAMLQEIGSSVAYSYKKSRVWYSYY